MNIIEFFELSAGKWFSQRTVHDLISGELQAGKSEVKIDLLPMTDPAAIRLCEQHSINPASVQGTGTRVSWNVVADAKQKNGSTVLVVIPNVDNPSEGKILQDKWISRYVMGSDEVVTLITETEDFSAEERWWYLMPNLRLRTSIIKRSNGMAQASFCSEIRMGVTQSPPKATAATAQS